MLTVSLPDDHAVSDVGALPEDVEVLVWDGTGPAPDGAARIVLFVGRYNAAPPPAAALAGLPRLRVVQVLSAGVEPWLPILPSGALLCNGRGVHGGSTAELAVGGLIAVLRELVPFADAQREHRWDQRDTGGLDGRRVLVLGAGDIGTRIADAVRLFGAEATLVARTARDGVRAFAELPDLLPDHDVAVLAVPHTDATHHLVDAGVLAALPDGAVLVNIARGGVVDTDALLAELEGRRLRAFLDVTDPEPLPADHPLWDAPNVLITPHVGGGTRGWERRANQLVRAQILRLRAGEELVNQVRDGY